VSDTNLQIILFVVGYSFRTQLLKSARISNAVVTLWTSWFVLSADPMRCRFPWTLYKTTLALVFCELGDNGVCILYFNSEDHCFGILPLLRPLAASFVPSVNMSQLALKYSRPAQHHFPQNSVTLVCEGNCDAGDGGADHVILLNGTSTTAKLECS